MPLLAIKQLTMQFGGLTAVNDLDLEVERGQIVSIIGPNGAGKTTVFNAVTGIYEPTAGSIEFENHELRRPFNWLVLAACILIGLCTGLAAAIVTANVDKLWLAAIKRNYISPREPFSYADAWRDAGRYLRGELSLARLRGGRWTVISADGRKTLAYAEQQGEAQAILTRLEEAMALPDPARSIAQRDGQWAILSADGERVLSAHPTHEAAQSQLTTLAEIRRAQRAAGRNLWSALLAGLLLGAAGTYSVWSRTRRTPDVISRAGIARTFQNIRLFQNMTVVENVLVGMDCHVRTGGLAGVLPGSRIWQGEQAELRKALELLQFVGLADERNNLAKNLPYGDQRRLEIARAMATCPRLLLLDEPAAGMNPAESGELMHLIRKIRDQGVTILLIEHHMKLVMNISDRIAVLDYGCKIAEGPPQEVRTNPRVIEAYLGKEDIG